jgi:looped-hinge helix DNA binding domain, AbrB family
MNAPKLGEGGMMDTRNVLRTREKDVVTTKVSSRFQIVIPKEAREAAGIQQGQVLGVVAREGTIVLVPHRPLAEYRGMFPGLDAEGLRDEDDRL